MPDDGLAEAYTSRLSHLEHVCHRLEHETRATLDEYNGEYRSSFHVADVDYFLAQAQNGGFDSPLVEVEDQIFGLVLVVDANAIRQVEKELRVTFSAVDSRWEGSESELRRLICVIPPQAKPPGWDTRDDVPKTFQLSVETTVELGEEQDPPPAVPFHNRQIESSTLPSVAVPENPVDGERSAEFDVFLAHNSSDKDTVEEISRKLEELGIRPWLDKEQIRPGQSFQDEIQAALGQVKSVAICIGESGLGKWQQLELRTAISQCVDNSVPVIPILLPGVSRIPASIPFLAEWNWVKFGGDSDDSKAIFRLAWGITGKKPSEFSTESLGTPAPTVVDSSVESGGQPGRSNGVVFALHGIRTHADWHRPLYELLSSEAWQVRTDRWVFGYYNVFQFLTPWSRRAKVKWFREAYNDETKDRRVKLSERENPSIVAHSFGTYILGNAMLKYDWLRFDKIILCGSILPVDFPWDKLIDRGQVQAVRNEHGVRDVWAKLVSWGVADTGISGHRGFERHHDRLVQEQFDYEHSEYFDRGHMEAKWLPFLNQQYEEIPSSTVHVTRPVPTRPLGLYAAYGAVLGMIALIALRTFGG